MKYFLFIDLIMYLYKYIDQLIKKKKNKKRSHYFICHKTV